MRRQSLAAIWEVKAMSFNCKTQDDRPVNINESQGTNFEDEANIYNPVPDSYQVLYFSSYCRSL